MLNIGIDFGTSNIRVSIKERDKLPRSLRIGTNPLFEFSMPSVAYWDKSGMIKVGEVAAAMAGPGKISHIKRYMQRRPEDLKHQTYQWKGDHISIGGKELHVKSIIKAIVKEAIRRAYLKLKEEKVASENVSWDAVNIGSPLDFDLKYRRMLSEILIELGFRTTLNNVIDEPVASAVLLTYYVLEEVKTILIFDCGAGTLDVALLSIERSPKQPQISVIAEAGRCLAGVDFDRLIAQVLIERIMQECKITSEQEILLELGSGSEEFGKLRLYETAERFKISLSNQPVVLEHLSFGGRILNIKITQGEFENRARKLLLHIKDTVESCIRTAAELSGSKFSGSNIDTVILVGGTSKIPCVQKLLISQFGRNRFYTEKLPDPLRSVVEGLAFSKDYENVILKRPPYSIVLEAVLRNGARQSRVIHEAFDRLYPWWKAYQQSVPQKVKIVSFDEKIEELEIYYRSPTGRSIKAVEVKRGLFKGTQHLEIVYSILGLLTIRDTSSRISVRCRTPYWSQAMLAKEEQEYIVSRFSLPDVYPNEN